VPKDDLSRGTYSGQAGPLYIEPASNPGGYDREVFLVLKEFEPSFSRGGDMAMHVLTGSPLPELQKLGEQADEQFKGPKGYEVGYELFSINGKMLGQGEPIRVKQGERLRVDHPHPAHGLIGRVLSGRTSSRVKSAFGRSWRPALKIDQYHPDPTPSRHRVAGLHGARYVP